MRAFQTVFRIFIDQFSATLYGKNENDQILVAHRVMLRGLLCASGACSKTIIKIYSDVILNEMKIQEIYRRMTVFPVSYS